MSRHYTKKSARFDVVFAPSHKASAHGGQLAIEALFHQFDLWRKVAREPVLDPKTHRGKGYDPHVYLAQLLFTFASGGGSLADAIRLDQDEALKALLGIEKFPVQSALGQWLRHIGPEGVDALRRLNRELVAQILERADPARHQHCGQTECFFDDTQIEVTGKKFEGAKFNYDSEVALSWQALFVGPLLVDSRLGPPPIHKESPASDQSGGDVSSALSELLGANRSLWDKEKAHL